MRQPLAQQQTVRSGSLSGHVVDATGGAVGGAVVEIRKLASRETADTLRSTTDASGRFAFGPLAEGKYTVSVSLGLRRSAGVIVTLPSGASRDIQVKLPEGSVGDNPGAAPPNPGIEFSDKPNFTIAGVTDWTAVGGHGSDATLRTSEDLARETLALKAQGAQRATTAASEGKSEEEARLRKAIETAPRSYAANRALGEFYLRTARYGQAVPLLKLASELNYAEPQDEYSLALACRGAGDLAQARQHLQRALERKDAAEYHRLAAQIDEQIGDPLDAVRQVQLATALDPSEANYFAWGSELLLHRAIWQAVEVFGRGAKAYPGSARMKTGWGAALFAGALYVEAAQRFCEASDLDPVNEEPYLFMGKSVLAAPSPLPCVRQRLQRFAELQPGNASANYFYAMVLSKDGQAADGERVTSLLRKALSIDPKFSDAYLQLGISAFAQRHYTEAIALYQQAVEANPQNGEAHYRLGVAYDRTGNSEKARHELALHEEIEKAQAEATEQQRRQIKQFLVASPEVPTSAAKP